MKTFHNPQRSLWAELSLRGTGKDPRIRSRVEEIISRVQCGGDGELFRIEEEISNLKQESIEVTAAEIADAANRISGELKKSIRQAMENIRAFHEAQIPRPVDIETTPGVRCIQRAVPIEKIGLYIPGGTAPLFSTILMLAVPAAIAGCREKIMCTPCRRDGSIAPSVLYTAHICGIDRIFRIGGAQAIAAMAFGTETIPKVDKIFGPGNQYVTTAKQILGGSVVAVDMPAGPSEVMVITDSSSSPAFAAADLLSQAEHGKDSQVILLATDNGIAEKVMKEVEGQKVRLERNEIAEQALQNSRCIVFDNTDDIVEFANRYAPEHLIVSTAEPWDIVNRITAAGSVFVGKYTPESAGDYASGTNHTLPTSFWARSYSGLNLDSFMRKMTIQEISREGLALLSETIVTMAEAEGLEAHANAVKLRIDD